MPESWRQAQGDVWEFVLTCCWPKQSWSCSCCRSFSLCSVRASASLIFLLSWQASCWCPLTLCFKSPTSPSSAATCARKKRKSRGKLSGTDHIKTEKTVRAQQEPRSDGIRRESERECQFSLRTSRRNVDRVDMMSNNSHFLSSNFGGVLPLPQL